MTRIFSYLFLLVMLFLSASYAFAEWQPAGDRIMTRWAEDVSPDNALPEYPRPQMVRDQWMNLNGLWDYAIIERGENPPDEYDGQILVPFPIESALSGVQKKVGTHNLLFYRRTFEVPADWQGQRLLLHFGAVDWHTVVTLNGVKIGDHQGGYDPFTFDITHALEANDAQELVVIVWDPSDDGHQARGKQVHEPHGFWYTSVTGIWQTVWLEPVAKNNGYIRDLQLTPDIDREELAVKVELGGKNPARQIKAVAMSNGNTIAEQTGSADEELTLNIQNPRLWSPDDPFLYDLEVSLLEGSETVDRVKSYFGMRKISLKKDRNGIPRIALNNEIRFQFGMLDQGWWPDGLYTAPGDAAFQHDIDVAKSLGFNMLRKHVKVEPARFYYLCDKAGMLIWQDMPSGDLAKGAGAEWGKDRNAQSARQFEIELVHMIDAFYNHPSVLGWVIFNEGWGQYDTERLTRWVEQLDPSRLVIGASGFIDYRTGDIHDVHAYPGPAGAPLEADRATMLGEFGGLGLPIEGHTWQKSGWGYQSYTNPEELTSAYEALLEKLHPYISRGISSAIYTQISDVEIEFNGMMTYDREVIKMDRERANAAALKLYDIDAGSIPFNPILATSQQEPQEWRYTLNEPENGWEQPEFNDRNWKTGAGGFGNPDQPGAIAKVGTVWDTENIWLRKTFELREADFDNPNLMVFHDFENGGNVYLNGELIAEMPEYQFAYTLHPLNGEARDLLQEGTNTIAVHVHRLSKRQYFDAGLMEIKK